MKSLGKTKCPSHDILDIGKNLEIVLNKALFIRMVSSPNLVWNHGHSNDEFEKVMRKMLGQLEIMR